MTGDKPLRTYESVRLRARELRKEMTPAEKVLWEQLRNRQLSGVKFRRQAPMGTFIADFYCAEKKLIIEIDGHVHDTQVEYDLLRTETMESLGYRGDPLSKLGNRARSHSCFIYYLPSMLIPLSPYGERGKG